MAVVVLDMERISSETIGASANLPLNMPTILKSEQQSDQEEENTSLLNEIIVAGNQNSNSSLSSEALDFRFATPPKGEWLMNWS